MNICAIICEFNPFHNGHKYLLEQAKKLSGCNAVLCVMSGSFTQRGEMCIADKFARARHAVSGGADCVVELPAAFSVAPAEIFAQGAVKILSGVPEVKSLAFGCENASFDFLRAAKFLLEESELFKNALKEGLAHGESYIKSYAKAFEAAGGEKDVLSKPNNILGLEYCKAVLRSGKDISIIPVQRTGCGFLDENLEKNFSSAGAIRKNIENPMVSENVPRYVYSDLKEFTSEQKLFEELIGFKLTVCETENLAKIYGCGEGLENRLKSLALFPYGKLVAEATGKRYSSSRIRRILLANLLGIYADDVQSYLKNELYLRPLAVKKESADIILPALSQSKFPVIFKQRDLKNLGGAAEKCFKKDEFAYKIWKFIFKKPINGFDYMITV